MPQLAEERQWSVANEVREVVTGDSHIGTSVCSLLNASGGPMRASSFASQQGKGVDRGLGLQ
ncbi:MAG: hypothetical protein LZF62_100018 [Nitrospira sp.]|nr:MAG: hypothetical protein LZF62_100018 [Nitrospira sp.]